MLHFVLENFELRRSGLRIIQEANVKQQTITMRSVALWVDFCMIVGVFFLISTLTTHASDLPGMNGDLSVTTVSVSPTESMEFINLPGGGFIMGSPVSDLDSRDNERPMHQVYLKRFGLGKYEVTNAQYAVFLNFIRSSSGYVQGNPEQLLFYDVENLSARIRPDQDGSWSVEDGYEDVAVSYVTWYGAVAFCEWLSSSTGLSFRLPTESEQEYAWRSGTSTRFFFGDDSSDLGLYAWFDDNKYDYDSLGHFHEPRVVGEKLPSPWGLYDISGNVWEWAQDYFCIDFYSTSESSGENPVCNDDSDGDIRAGRGGSYQQSYNTARSADRHWAVATDVYRGLGFRVVLEGYLLEVEPHLNSVYLLLL